MLSFANPGIMLSLDWTDWKKYLRQCSRVSWQGCLSHEAWLFTAVPPSHVRKQQVTVLVKRAFSSLEKNVRKVVLFLIRLNKLIGSVGNDAAWKFKDLLNLLHFVVCFIFRLHIIFLRSNYFFSHQCIPYRLYIYGLANISLVINWNGPLKSVPFVTT
jgi:hypothetical protein